MRAARPSASIRRSAGWSRGSTRTPRTYSGGGGTTWRGTVAACALFGDFGKLPKGARNHLWLTFTDPGRRELLTDWNASTRLLAAKFRADSAHHLGDPAFEQLIESLRNASPEFCKAWKRHEVARSGTGRKILNHPVAGELTFEHVVWHPSDSPEQRMILYTPVPDTGTAERLAALLSDKVQQ